MKRSIVLLLVTVLLLATTACDLFLPPDFTLPPAREPAPSPVAPGTSPPPASPINPSWTRPSTGPGVAPGAPSFSDVVKLASPSVVSIQTEVPSLDIFLQPVPRQGAGSGVVIDNRGYVVTNNHVVEDARAIKVTLNDGRVFDAVKIVRDPQSDLAVVQIQGNNLPVAKLGRSDALRVGDWVVAIGNALALEGGATVTAGIVSYIGRTIQEPNGATLYNLIQTDAAINPGNSGGALLNLAGEVVGINTAIAGEAQNIGFAIAITPAMTVIEQLITTGRVTRAWLGVSLLSVTPAIVSRYSLSVSEGVLLTTVQRGSPADRAGLKVSDVIISFDGQKIAKAEQLRLAIQARKPGDIVQIVYLRGGEQITTRATLGESPL